MAIRPVDMSAAMPRAMEGSRAIASENARPVVEQQQFAQQLQRSALQERTTVQNANKSEGQKVDKDGRGNSGGGGDRKRRRDKGSDNDSGESGAAPGQTKKSLLDITL